jgi:hypothetical protein
LRKDVAFLSPPDLPAEEQKIEHLLVRLQSSPKLVLEATKRRYQPDVVLQVSGFEPLPATVVYPKDSVVIDGWVFHSGHEVLSLLRRAAASRDPAIASDPDGESLEYAFALLKSHLELLRQAREAGLAVVYAETNPA